MHYYYFRTAGRRYYALMMFLFGKDQLIAGVTSGRPVNNSTPEPLVQYIKRPKMFSTALDRLQLLLPEVEFLNYNTAQVTILLFAFDSLKTSNSD